MVFGSVDVSPLYEYFKTYFTMCTNLNNYVPTRPWFDDDDEEEQSGYDYRDDMIAQFKQDLYNKNFTLQDQDKDNQIDTLQIRNKFWPNVIDDRRVRNHMMIFMIMIKTMKDWIILFAVQRYFLREGNKKIVGNTQM